MSTLPIEKKKLSLSKVWERISLEKVKDRLTTEKKFRGYLYLGEKGNHEHHDAAMSDLDQISRDRPRFGLKAKNFSENEPNLDLKPYLLREGNKYKFLTSEEFHNAIHDSKKPVSDPAPQTPKQESANPASENILDKKLYSAHERLAHIDMLKSNSSYTPEEFTNITTGQGELTLPAGNRFKPKRTSTGQVHWTSDKPVNAREVDEVIAITSKLGRSLHINTGTHGDHDGTYAYQDKTLAEIKFAVQDLKNAWNHDNVSVHIVASILPPVTPKQRPDVDIIDAWCFSELSQHTKNESDSPSESVLKDIFSQLCAAQKPRHSQTSGQHAGVNATSNTGNSFATGDYAQQSNFGNNNSSNFFDQSQQGSQPQSTSSQGQPRPTTQTQGSSSHEQSRPTTQTQGSSFHNQSRSTPQTKGGNTAKKRQGDEEANQADTQNTKKKSRGVNPPVQLLSPLTFAAILYNHSAGLTNGSVVTMANFFGKAGPEEKQKYEKMVEHLDTKEKEILSNSKTRHKRDLLDEIVHDVNERMQSQSAPRKSGR